MSTVKILVSSLPNIGKTTLLQSLKDCLVIARDGKKYPFPQSHVNVPDFTSAEQLIDLIISKVNAYEDTIGSLPKTIVIDSISKILLDIEGYTLEAVKSFPYGKINTEIKKVVDFIERDIAPQFNVVLVSHAMYDEDSNSYKLVNAGGSYGKKGGILSEVDEAIFLELKGKNRVVHFKNSRMASRTTVTDSPESVPVEDFNLQEHIEGLMEKQDKVSDWTL